MLSIAPLDYERYASLIAPPPLSPGVGDLNAVEANPGQRDLTLGGKAGRSELAAKAIRPVVESNGLGHLSETQSPPVLPAFFNPSSDFPKATPTQLGLTPEKVAGLYGLQGKDALGILQIGA